MNNIFEAIDSFPFKSIKLSKPKSTTGGNWLIKFGVNNTPLYIQAPKCNTKSGFLKAGKRYYTDLVFSNDNDEFIRWMENLEIMCHEHLHENRSVWFDSEMVLERHDIENYFTSPMKIYKTGKYYIVRVNVETNLGVPALTIYDETNNQVDIGTINDKQDVISILEFKGIKCTSTSFQIEIEMKQMVTVKPVELFTKCVIRLPNQSNETILDAINSNIEEPMHLDKPENNENNENNEQELSIDTEDNSTTTLLVNDKTPIDTLDKINNNQNLEIDTDTNGSIEPENNNPGSTVLENIDNTEIVIYNDNPEENNDISIDTLIEPTDNNNELQEFKIDLDTLTEDVNINIKKDNDIYYDMYREACRKAKIASDLALSSYLEAKRIKNLYMLDDITDSDDSENEENSDTD